ncbi:hypothetical protein [Blautia producta]|uniref:hypothetical protein n=1 Tax=Blautia producta TaxID=33035 RepID=UPI0031B5C73F
MEHGIIGRRTVRRWLNNWEHLVRREPMEDQLPGNGGCKPADGITNGMLNKIMLEMAYDRLPYDLKRVAYFRWIVKGQYSLTATLQHLNMTKDQYYYRCDLVIDSVFNFVNGYNN